MVTLRETERRVIARGWGGAVWEDEKSSVVDAGDGYTTV